MENAFAYATRHNLGFDFNNSQVTVLSLWGPVSKGAMQNAHIAALEKYEEALIKKLEESFNSKRRKIQRSGTQKLDEIRLEIVSFILDTYEQEKDAELDAAKTKAENSQLLEIIAERKQEEFRKKLEGKSASEIEAMLK